MGCDKNLELATRQINISSSPLAVFFTYNKIMPKTKAALLKYFSIIVIFLCLALMLSPLRRAASSDSFLMDEALQFYTAIGDHHFNLGNRIPGDASEVVFRNFNDNLDPGGFTLLLNFWSHLSENPSWLRLLPFSLFFMALILSFLTLLQSDLKRWPLALFITFLIGSYSPMLNWSFILRAYSLEIFGVAYLALLFSSGGRRRPLFHYLPLLFFCFSRYSYFVFLGIFTVFELHRREHLTKRLLTIALSIGLALSLLFGLMVAPALSHKLPLYIQQFTLLYRISHSEGFSDLLVKNFSSLPYSLLFIQLIIYITLKRSLTQQTRRQFLYCLSMHSTFIYLSAMGLYPWVSTERFGLSLSFLTLITGALFIRDLLWNNDSLRALVVSPIVATLIIIPTLGLRSFHFDSYSAMAPSLDYIPLGDLNQGSVFLGHNAFFEAYFLFDLGRYKDKRDLFNRFEFDRPRDSYRPSLKYKYLVISQLDRENKNYIENELNLKPINNDGRTFVYKVGNNLAGAEGFEPTTY